jgi:hypothetical protein
MRSSFLRHQIDLNAYSTQVYKQVLDDISRSVSRQAIGYRPLPMVSVWNTQDGGHAMIESNTATNSPGAALGRKNTAGVINSVVTIGASATERVSQVNAVSDLIERIKGSDLGDEQKAEAVRNLINVKEEVNEAQDPDKGRIAKWLSRSKDIIGIGVAGTDLIEKANDVFRMFGGSS